MAAHPVGGMLDVPPVWPHLDTDGKQALLQEALRGIPFGSHDEATLQAVAADADTTTVRTVVSWLDRVRSAGYDTGVRRVIATVERVLEATERGDPR